MKSNSSMGALECIYTRRSIRKYTGEPVTEEQLHTILRAGFSAPTAMNTRPWRFIVVRDKAVLDEVTNAHKFSKMLPSAGCCVVVCGDTSSNGNEAYLAEDGSAAIQNMLLAAHALGLGAVWLGLHPQDDHARAIRPVLQLPESVLPVGMFALGVPAEIREAPDRYDETMVHYEKW